jgi:hypothetical protein
MRGYVPTCWGITEVGVRGALSRVHMDRERNRALRAGSYNGGPSGKSNMVECLNPMSRILLEMQMAVRCEYTL